MGLSFSVRRGAELAGIVPVAVPTGLASQGIAKRETFEAVDSGLRRGDGAMFDPDNAFAGVTMQ
jgi:hypothetical protein